MHRLEAAWEDPAQRARLLKWAWLISTGFTVFGFAVILYLLFLKR
ncbi:MAG TPA: hypothetical protein VIB49_07240 [Thermoplasmata archaeon]|jgi:hypothetical protein